MRKIEIGELENLGSGDDALDNIIISLPVNRVILSTPVDCIPLISVSHNRVIAGNLELEIARNQGGHYVYVEHSRIPRQQQLQRQWAAVMHELTNKTAEIQLHVLTAIFQHTHQPEWFQERGLVVNGRPISQAFVATRFGISPQVMNARIKKYQKSR